MASNPTSPAPANAPWGLARITAHQLLPGFASLAVLLPLLRGFAGSGVPPMVWVFVAILIVETPLSWFLMLRALRVEGSAVSIDSLFPWRRRVGIARAVGIGIVLVIVGMIGVFALSQVGGPPIRLALFQWVPAWAVLDSGPEGMAGASRAGLMWLWALSGVVGVGVGGVTQELYHRGFLLPRSQHLGAVAVPLNAALFAMAHPATPWNWPFIALASTFWAGAVYRWRAMQLGVIGHVGMLAVGWLMMTAVAFGWITLP